MVDRRVGDDHAAMHLGKSLGIEPAEQLLERRADDVPIVRRHDLRVFVRGLEVEHVVHGDESRAVFQADRQPADRGGVVRHPRARRRGGIGRRRAAALQLGDAAQQALVRHRFEQVVDRRLVECLDRIFVMGRHEHDMHVRDEAGHFQPVDAGHPDVEKREIGALRIELGQRVDAVARQPDDVELGPEPAQAGGEFRGQIGFVVGDQGGRHVSRAECAGWRSRLARRRR